MKNIVLIGLPASGKTTVGRVLAKELNRPFFDTDEMIERSEGKCIAELFASEGEAAFRAKEHAVLLSAAQQEGAVIATGGGSVLDAECMRALKRTGRLYFLDRSLADIACSMGGAERPLLGGSRAKLEQLRRERDRLYRKYADTVISGGSIEEIVETVALYAELTGED